MQDFNRRVKSTKEVLESLTEEDWLEIARKATESQLKVIEEAKKPEEGKECEHGSETG